MIRHRNVRKPPLSHRDLRKTAAVLQLSRRIVIAQTTALLTVLAVVLPTEFAHWREVLGTPDSFGINVDTSLALLLIVLLPYFWFVRRPFWSPTSQRWQSLKVWWNRQPGGMTAEDSNAEKMIDPRFSPWSIRQRWMRPKWTALAVLIIVLTSLEVSGRVNLCRVGDREQFEFHDLPPAYHDEYSYLFQAKTFFGGHLSYPSHATAARLFDQMHVVNEGRFASRYFPGTGLFITPWLWFGWPILGHLLAGVLTAVLVFGIGRELSSNGTGFVAGMLTALSPGIALFGNLLLAHHPTLLGLFFFAWSFLRWLRLGLVRDAALAGIGLSWAMLCRPMTAAGFGLPFGLVFVAVLARRASEWRVPNHTATPRWRVGLVTPHLLAMSLPLVGGFVVLAIHNHAITGSVMTSPYQLFNDIYTPRHVYGFNNVERGEQHLGPRVLDHYDRWAINLTPALAVENAKNRLIASWQWTVGLVPLLAGLVAFVLTGSSRDRRWWLILSAIVSLFAVHVPYWFVGMFNWHYVFETGPLWCLLLASATDTLSRAWLAAERPRMPVWWTLLIASSVVVNVIDFAPFWFPSKLQAGVEQVAFSRLTYHAFDELLRREVRQRPALVLIEADPADRHIDFVVNEPDLSSEVLRGRYPVADWPLERIVAEFPDRAVYLFRAKTGELRRVRQPGIRETENGE